MDWADSDEGEDISLMKERHGNQASKNREAVRGGLNQDLI